MSSDDHYLKIRLPRFAVKEFRAVAKCIGGRIDRFAVHALFKTAEEIKERLGLGLNGTCGDARQLNAREIRRFARREALVRNGRFGLGSDGSKN